jgi:hypothetical protein
LAKFQLGVLSLGVFLIIVAVWVAAWLLEFVEPVNIVPLVLMSSGVWIVVVAGLKAVSPEKEGAFSNLSWGTLFIVLGGSLYMINMGMEPLYTVVFVLVLVGALAVVTALRSSRK